MARTKNPKMLNSSAPPPLFLANKQTPTGQNKKPRCPSLPRKLQALLCFLRKPKATKNLAVFLLAVLAVMPGLAGLAWLAAPAWLAGLAWLAWLAWLARWLGWLGWLASWLLRNITAERIYGLSGKNRQMHFEQKSVNFFLKLAIPLDASKFLR